MRRAFVVAAFLSFATASVASAPPGDWQPGPPRAEPVRGAGKVWFSKEFQRTAGIFPAIYPDIVDGPDRIEGDFLIATFRYVYDVGIGESGSVQYPLHDESVNEVVLDCQRGFNGAISTRYLLAGEEVFVDRKEQDDLILMLQNSVSDFGNTADALCEFARTQAAK